ncbi:MAG: hypothetical protein JO157_13975 [Acetobacteraceae bacterium]|nr:hypothetical protein [Acetobacteraceae bacterium]
MTPFQQELRHLALLFWAFLDFVLAWIAYGWQWLRDMLADSGVPSALQTALLIAVAALLVVGLLKVMGGMLRLLFVVAAGLLIARAVGAI